MTALEDSKESIKECAKRWGGYKAAVPVSNTEAAKIKKKAESLKAERNQRMTDTRRRIEAEREMERIYMEDDLI